MLASKSYLIQHSTSPLKLLLLSRKLFLQLAASVDEVQVAMPVLIALGYLHRSWTVQVSLTAELTEQWTAKALFVAGSTGVLKNQKCLRRQWQASRLFCIFIHLVVSTMCSSCRQVPILEMNYFINWSAPYCSLKPGWCSNKLTRQQPVVGSGLNNQKVIGTW